MFDLVFFDVTVGNGMNADRRLATLARTIWFGTLCGGVPRLVTVVTDVSPIGLRDTRSERPVMKTSLTFWMSNKPFRRSHCVFTR